MKTLAFNHFQPNNQSSASFDNLSNLLTNSIVLKRADRLIPPAVKTRPFRKFLPSARAIALAILVILVSSNAFTQNRVQSTTGSTAGTSGATTITMAPLATSPINGNTLVAIISTRGTAISQVSAITQTGATWSRISQVANTNSNTTEIWYAPNVSGAGTAITITLASLRAAAVVIEYNGILTPAPFDVSATSTGNSTSASTGTTVATAQANELWIGGIGLGNGGYSVTSPTNGFTIASNAATAGSSGSGAAVYALEKIVASTGTATTGGTVSTSSQWSGTIATFKAITPVTFTSTGGGGNWNTAATWDQNAVPTSGSSVVIAAGSPVTLNASTASLKNLTINSQFDLSNNSYTVSGAGTLAVGSTGSLLVGGIVPSGFATTTIDPASTVNFNSGSTQSIPALTYGNLTLSGGSAKNTAATGTVAVGGIFNVNAGTTCNLGSSTLTVTGATSVSGIVNSSIATGLKTFTGAVTVNSGGTWDLSGFNPPTSFGGGITNNSTNTLINGTGAAAFTTSQSLSGTGNMSFGGTVTPAAGTTLTNSSSGTVTAGGTIVLTGNFTQGSGSTLALSAAAPFSGAGILDAQNNPNTVAYTNSGAPQAIQPSTYYNLNFSGNSKTIAGDLSIASGGNFISTTSDIVFNGNYTNPNALLNAGYGTIEISGALTQSIAGFTTNGAVTMNKSANTALISGNMTCNGLVISGSGSGTLDLGSGTHTSNLSVSLLSGKLNGSTSTLNVHGGTLTAWNGTGSVFNAGLGTVNFNNGDQSLIASATTFNNLTFSAGGTKILSSVTTINNFTIAIGTYANLGTALPVLVHSAKILTLGTTPQTDLQSYGGNTSGATNIIPASFADATGVLNVQASTGAVRLKITGPSAFTVGVPQTITITALNSSGGAYTGYLNTGTYTFSGASAAPNSPTSTPPTITDNQAIPAAIPFGTNTPNITFVNGVATVQLTLYKAESNINISVTDGPNGTSGTILTSAGADRLTVSTVAPGPLAALALNFPVTAQSSGAPFTGSPTLTATDAWNNVATNFNAATNNVALNYAPVATGTGTISGLGSPSGAVLNLSGSFTNGVASLSGMIFTGTPGTYTFTASSTTPAVVTSPASVQITIGSGNFYARTSGNWSTLGTWALNATGTIIPSTVIPGVNDNVYIEPGVNLNVDSNESCALLTFDGTGTGTSALTIPSPVILNVTGAVTANSCNSIVGFNTTSTVSGAGTLNCGSVQVGTTFATTTAATRTTIMTSTLANFNVNNNLTVSSFIGSTNTRIINSSFILSSGNVDIDGVLTTTNANAVNGSTFSMAGGSGQLNLSSAVPVSLSVTGTSTIAFAGTSSNIPTVIYDGAGQTVYATPYTNLTLAGLGTDILTGVTTIGGNFAMSGSVAATTASTLAVGGNLTLGGTSALTTGAALTVTGNLGIGDGTIVNVGAYNLGVTGITTVGGGSTGQLIFNSLAGTKTFTGQVSIAAGGIWNNPANSAVEFRGGITNNATGTFTAGSGVHSFTTNAQALNGTFSIPGLTVTSPAVLTNNNLLTVGSSLAGTGTLTQAPSATLNIGGASTISTLTATATNNTVDFTGVAQTIPAFNYFNLTNSGSGTTVLASSGIIGISGTFVPGTATYTTTGSTVSFRGTTAQIVPVMNYNNMTINNIAGASLSGAISLSGPGVLTLTAGNLTTSSLNSLTLTNTAVGAISGGSATSYVDGPLARSLPSNLTTGKTYAFPVGNNSNFFGFALVNPVTGTSATVATVQATNADSGGLPDASLSTINHSFYWSLGMNPSGGGFNSQVALSDPTNPTNFGVIASSSSQTGTYTNRGGATSGGATVTSASVIGSDTYFTLGNLPPHYIVTSSGYSPVAGSDVTIFAQLYDGNNNMVTTPTSNTINWTQTDGSGTAGHFASASSLVTNGLAQVVFTTSTVAGTSTQITGTDAGALALPGQSAPIITVFGPDAQLVWGTQPGDANVGAAIPVFTVQIEDVNGNITNSSSTVNLVKNSGGGPGTLSGNSAVASGSVASFSASSINAPGKYSLIATTSAFVSVPSNTFNINPNAVSTLASGSTISATPSSIGANTTATITMHAADAAGNQFTTGGLTVTFHTTLGSIGTATDHGDGSYSATLTSGIASGTATVTFTISGTAPDPAQNSVQVIFTPGTLDHFVVEKSGGGSILAQVTTTAFPVQVTAYDANGNIATSFTGASNTVDISSNGTLSGGTFQSAAFVNGVLNPISVTVNNVGNFYITATQHGGTITANSNSFNVVASGPDRYSFANGDWNSTSTWAYSPTATTGGADIPATGTPVHMVNGKTVTVSSSGAVCGTLDFASNGTGSNTLSTLAGGTLTTGVITIPNAGVGYANTLDGNAGNITAASIAFPYTSGQGSQSLTISTGSVTVSGGITTTSGSGSTASVNFTGAGTLTVGGNFFNTGSASYFGFLGSFDGSLVTYPGCTVIYNGSGAQGVKGGVTYYNITLSNSGLKTFTNFVPGSVTGLTVNGVLSFGGTATMAISSNGGVPATATNLVYAAPNGTLQYNTTSSRSGSTTEWPTPFVGSGGVIIASTGTITMPGTSVFNPGVPLTVNNLATLNTGNNALTLGGDFINNGTFTPGSSSITINSNTTSQNIGSFSTTGTVTFAKSAGTATLQGALVTGPFVLNGAGVLSDNNFAVNGGVLTLLANSAITLGGNVHQLHFADSHLASWSGGTTLTITGWQGNYSGGSGTAGQIFVGGSAGGLSPAQLAQIRFFDGVNYFTSIILPTGEVVPAFNLFATAISAPPFCVVSSGTTASGTLSYTSNNTYSGATYTAYLSDASGSFANPVSIGTVNVTNPGTPNTLAGSFPVTIPANTASGTGYTIRVDMTSPAAVPGNKVTTPFTVVSGVSNVTSPGTDASQAGQVTLSWTNPTNCFQGVMIVAKAGSAATGVPSGPVSGYAWNSGNLSYGTGTEFGGGFVVYQGTGSGSPAPTVYNLTGGTTYYYTLFTWNGNDWSSGITVNATPAGNITAFNGGDLFRTVANGAWTNSAIWNESSDGGLTWNSFPVGPTNYPDYNSAGIAVNNKVSISSNLTIDQTVVNASGEIDLTGGILTLNNGADTDLNVLGILDNSDPNAIVINLGANLAFGSTGVYVHAVDGGTIPTATWVSGSLCNITGVITTIPAGMTQSFSNLTWNNTGQTVAPTSNGTAALSVSGTFTFASSGTGGTAGSYLWPAANCSVANYVHTGGTDRLSSTGAAVTHTISGAFSVSGGTVDFARGTGTPTINVGGDLSVSGSGSVTETGTGVVVLNVGGNLNIIGGTFTQGTSTSATTVTGNVAVSAGILDGGAGSATFNVNGNLTVSGTGSMSVANTSATPVVNIKGNLAVTGTGQMNGGTGSAAENINFISNPATHTFTAIGTFAGYQKWNILTGATVDFGTSVLLNSNASSTFSLALGGGILTANTGGLSLTGSTGSIQTGGARSYNAGANYTYNGAAAQVTGSGLAGTNNLTINNSTGVTLSGPVAVGASGILTLTSGILTTTAANLLTLTNTAVTSIGGSPSATVYINGPFKWILPTWATGSSYNFPVGTSTHYLPFSLVNPTTSGASSAQVQAIEPGAAGATAGATLYSISTSEYWSLATGSNFTNSSVSLNRPSTIFPLDAVGGATTAAGAYTWLGGSAGANSVSNSNVIGSNRYFVLAGKLMTITTTEPSSVTIGTNSPYCAGSTLSVAWTTDGTFYLGNVFSVELSNGDGTWPVTPNVIATATVSNNGTVNATIPSGTPTGTHYRIRVAGSAPLIIGSDNGTDFTINSLPSGIIGDGTTAAIGIAVCLNDGQPPVAFTGSNGTAPYTFTYHINGGPDLTTTSDVGNNVKILNAPTGTAGTFTYYLTKVQDVNSAICSTLQTQSYVVIVNPVPDVTNPGSQTVCNLATESVIFVGSVTGTVYNWTNDNTSIGLAASGTGNISFTAANSTSSAVIAHITVTPSYTSADKTCIGTPVNFIITVDPTPVANQVSNVTYCNTAVTSAIALTSPTSGATFTWANNNTAIGLAASGGPTSTIPSFTATNNGSAPVSGTISVTPTANNCAGAAMTFTITVNPTGQVNTTANQVVCQGSGSAAVIFGTSNTGGTTTYAWTNDNTAIGLGTDGTGNIASFTATNITTAPIVANITVTPTFTNGSVSCAGPEKSFTITVNPTGQVNSVSNQILCPGTNTNVVSFTTNNSGGTTTYAWSNNATEIGLASGGTGNIGGFTATNTTSAPIVATISTTPTFTNGAMSCAGTVQTFTITVNPAGQVNLPDNQVVCQGSSTSAVNFSTANTGGTTTYSWTNDATGIGLLSGGAGNIPAFTATNTTGIPIVATITVTPTFTNGTVGCAGTPKTFTITVNPVGQVNATANQIVCQGNSTAAVNFSSANTGGITTFAWTNSASSIGLAAGGTGNIASFSAINSTTAPVVATITVTPTFTNGAVSCAGMPQIFMITVNPDGQVNVPANQVVCSGVSTTGVTFTTNNTVGTTTYSWTNTSADIGLSASGTGNIAAFTATNTTLSPIIATITVTPTFTNGTVGCTGTPQSFTITVNPIPTITSTVPGTNCGPGTVTLTAAASAGTVSWYAAATGGSALGTGPSFTTPSLSATTTYYVGATSNACSSADRTAVTATINPLPAPVITGPASVCAGTTQAYSVTSTANHAYAWAVSGGTIASGQSTSSVSITWGSAGSGTVNVTETITATSCPAAAPQRAITINALPAPAISPVASVYINTNATYTTESGMTNYVWTFSGVLNTDYTIISGGKSTDNTVTVQYLIPNTTQTVLVNYTNGNGCTAATPASTATTVKVLNELTISANRVTKTYGDVLTSYTDNSGASYTAYGLAPGESISSVVITYGNGSGAVDGVGNYSKTIVPTNATGNFNPANYAHITYLNGDINVVAKSLVISANPATKTYGDILTGGTVSTGYTAVGTVNGETVSSVTINYSSGFAAVDLVGTYPGAVTVTNPAGAGTFNRANYTITFNPATLTVSRAPVTITAINVNKPFGSVLTSGVYLAEGNIIYTGLKNGETIGIVTMGYGLGSLAIDLPGDYPGQVEASSPLGNPPFSAGNYAIRYINGTIHVGTVTLTVTAQDKNHCFDNLPYSGGYSVSYSGFMPGDSPSVLGGSLIFGGSAIGATAPGNNYAIIPGGYTSSKYMINYVSGTLTINSAPAAAAGSSRTICHGSQTTLGAVGIPGNSYYWTSSPAGYTSNLANPTVSPSVTTTYTVSETVIATGCSNTNSVLVTVNPVPAAVSGADRAICSGNSTTLGAAAVPGSTYSWISNMGGFSSVLSNPSVSPAITSTYTVTETITATGCTNTNSVVVTVNPAASAFAGSNRAICMGSNTTIGAAPVAGSIYSWSSVPAGFASTLANPVVSPVVNTTYTVTETTATGCVNSNNVTVNVNPLPLAIAGADATICLNKSVSLGGASVPGNNYSWSSQPSGFNSFIANPSVTPMSTTTYTLVESIALTGCSNTHNVTVTVKSAPVAFTGVNRAICYGTSTTLGTSAVGSNTYSWSSIPAGFTSFVSNPEVHPTVNTAYTLVETNIVTGCSASNTVNVTVNPAAAAVAGNDISICAGSGTTIGGQPVYGSTYSWSSIPAGFTSSSSNPAVRPTVTTMYTVTETTAAFCTNSNSVKVTVNVLPAAYAGINQTICSGSGATLGTTAVVGSTYSWTASDGSFTSSLPNPAVSPTTTTTYTLVETNTAGGCQNQNSVTITVIPKAVPTISTSGGTSLCQGTSSIFTTEGHKSSYLWIVTGGSLSSGGGVADSTATVTWNAVGNQSVAVTYSNGNNCPAGVAAVQNVTVNAYPGAAGVITGTTVVCTPGNNLIYSVPANPNAKTYLWSVPAGGIIISGQGSNSITVNFDSTTHSDSIRVHAVNDCASGKSSGFAIVVTPKPGAAGAISGPDTFTQGSTGETFSVAPIDNATSYTWTFPTGGSIVSGLGTNSVTVSFSSNANPGGVTVFGSNVCGQGASSASLALTIPDKTFKIYPVPSNGIFTAAITFPHEETFTINIYDHLGAKVMEITDAKTVGGFYSKVINLDYLANGLYFVEFTNSTFREVRKLLISR